jgi:hypothetical protein
VKKDSRAVVYGIPGKKVVDDVPKTSDEENKKQAKEAGESKAAMAEEAWRAKAPAAGPLPKFSLPVAEKAQLPNGLTIYLVQRHNLPLVAARLYTISGSELNPLDKPGLSGFTADMLTEGTATRSALKFAEDTDQIDGDRSGIRLQQRFSLSFGIELECRRRTGAGFRRGAASGVCRQRSGSRSQSAGDGSVAGKRRAVRAGVSHREQAAVPQQSLWIFGARNGSVEQGDHARRFDGILEAELRAAECGSGHRG